MEITLWEGVSQEEAQKVKESFEKLINLKKRRPSFTIEKVGESYHVILWYSIDTSTWDTGDENTQRVMGYPVE